MKVSKIIWGLSILIILAAASATFARQTFTQTVTLQNLNCNSTCTVLDIPESVSPSLIIFATPVPVNGANPHPIGAYYMYLNKWSIFNLDATAMPVGTKFNVEYYDQADANHFVYVVPKPDTVSYIDHAGLNNNPTAQPRVFPTSPVGAGSFFNRSEIRIAYDASASRWLIGNINNSTFGKGVAYNVAFSGGMPASSPGAGGNCNCDIPTSLPPNGKAGGDLGGTYPNPSVEKLQGKPVSKDLPSVGQFLRWNGAAWEPAEAPVATNPQPAPGPSMQTFFKQQNIPGAVYPIGALTDNSLPFNYTGLSHSIVLTKRSRLVISATIDVTGPQCSLGTCTDGKGYFYVEINGAFQYPTRITTLVPHDNSLQFSVVNFMIDKDPGTYNIEFKLGHQPSWNLIFPGDGYSSIMILPLS
jgi:hypothetical protein